MSHNDAPCLSIGNVFDEASAILLISSTDSEKMSEEEDTNIPDAATCQSRCVEFAKITGTDEACAQFFLQDHDWDLSVRQFSQYFIVFFSVLMCI